MWPFTFDYPLDHHRSGMSNERSDACGQPGFATSRLQQGAQRGGDDPPQAVLAEV
jgi:hypothetical protein